MKIVWRILEIILVVILLFTITINACFAYSKYIKKDEIANVFGYTYMTVLSNSMYPTFKFQDKVVILLNGKYQVGDIITYKLGNAYVTHRVVKINGNKIVTKGDANNAEDEPITGDMIVGVVKKIIE